MGALEAESSSTSELRAARPVLHLRGIVIASRTARRIGRWALIAALVVVGTFVLDLIFPVPLWRAELSYSGSCGRFRYCVTRYGLFKKCEVRESGLFGGTMRPFAPQASCDADWNRLWFAWHSLTFIADGKPSSPGGVIAKRLLVLRDREEEAIRTSGAYDTDPKALNIPLDDVAGYAVQDCQGFKNLSAVKEYRVVVSSLGAKKPDCWVLSSDGQLRHLPGGAPPSAGR